MSIMQALRHLRNVQVINFGDCLVRTEGAIALAAVLTEGLPILKVSSHLWFRSLCLLCQQSDYICLLSTLFPGAQSVIW